MSCSRHLTIATGFLAVLLFSSLTGWTSSDDMLNQEVSKRKLLAKPLEEGLKISQDMANQGSVLEAYNLLNKSYQGTSEGIKQTAIGASVRGTLSAYSARLAELAVQKNHWPEARERALTSL